MKEGDLLVVYQTCTVGTEVFESGEICEVYKPAVYQMFIIRDKDNKLYAVAIEDFVNHFKPYIKTTHIEITL